MEGCGVSTLFQSPATFETESAAGPLP